MSSDICAVLDEIDIPSHRAVGLAQVPFEPGETVHLYIEGDLDFKNTVIGYLESHFFPYVNLDFVVVHTPQESPSGALVTVTSDTTTLSPGASGTCRFIGTKTPYVIIGILKRRTCIHELCHAVGMLHELDHPNKTVTFDREHLARFFVERKALTHDEATRFVDRNFFKASSYGELSTTEFDPQSVMLYSMPAASNLEGVELVGGTKLSRLDKRWLREAYGMPRSMVADGTAGVGSRRALDTCPACPSCDDVCDAKYGATPHSWVFWIAMAVTVLACAWLMRHVLIH